MPTELKMNTATSTTPSSTLTFKLDHLDDSRVIALLNEHLRDMHSISPPESVHALDLDKLRKPNIHFWSVWSSDDDEHAELVGTCALMRLDATHAELKSMRVVAERRGKGDAQKVLDHVIDHARESGIARISLETGTPDYFIPARRLYERNGFEQCGPFGEYQLDPYSCFMTRTI